MVVTAATETTKQLQGGLRPLEPTRDLKAITELIAEAFANELDERARAALREMRWMARLSPLVWWLSQADPGFRDAFNGFVWEEPSPQGSGSQIVGNVSLNQAPGSRGRYIICNVVVHDAYRGQGIGRKLTEAAIAEANALRTSGIVLQVYKDNLPALRLYTGLGFQEASGETDLRLDAAKSVAFLDSPGYHCRRWKPADGQAVRELANIVTPRVQQWIRPLSAGKYNADWLTRFGQWFSDLMAGRRIYRLTMLKGERLVAMMTVSAALRRGQHQLSLLVHPDHSGQVEGVLVSRALYMLSAVPAGPIRATVDMDHQAALDVLGDYGFQKGRTLLTLRKDF